METLNQSVSGLGARTAVLK